MSKDKAREFWIKGHCVLCDVADYSTLSQFKWSIKKDKKTFYAQANIFIAGKQTSILMHRILTGMRKVEVDHINRNGLDNRRCNLRFCTPAENQRNRVRINKHGFRGIYKPKRSPHYSVQIQVNGRRIHKHGFKTLECAAKYYDKLSKDLHGEFGIRNFKD